MTIQGFTVSHERGARFEPRLRCMTNAAIWTSRHRQTDVEAHVIRSVPGALFSEQPHLHRTTFQWVLRAQGLDRIRI